MINPLCFTTDLDTMAWNNRGEFKLGKLSAQVFKDCFPC